MSRLPVSPIWSSNANIPIYLDTGDDKQPSESKRISENACPTCETSSRDQPIHCISITSPAPPSYSSISSQPPASGNLAVPVLRLETPYRLSRPEPPRPALHFDPEGRPRLRFRRNAFSPLSPQTILEEDIDWSRKSHVGLGIPDAQFKPDASPLTPGTVEKDGVERTSGMPGASNFAQRIEQKLWKYSASGNVAKRWLLEIISWSLSASCMAGIIGMLIFYKDKRIPTWPLGLTLNAYISVLSKVASAALLLPVSEAIGQLKWSWFQGSNSKKMWDFEIFDNASRGPWGSLLLLVRTKGRSLAALGAAVTIFALALDPFFQQVVQYPERWRVQENSPGYLPNPTTYEPARSGKEYRMGQESQVVDQSMLGSMSQFFYNNGTTPISFGKGVRAEVPLTCPFSNCTWPEYDTLGVCNTCEDVSNLLEYKCINKTLDWIQVPGVDEETGNSTFPNGTSCGWFLKADDPILMVGYEVGDSPHKGEILITRTQPLYDVVTRELLSGYPSKLNNTRNPLAHVVISSGQSLAHIARNSTPIAHECIISWCVKTMQSSYSDGGYSEQVVNTHTNGTLGTTPWTVFNFSNGNPIFDGQYYVYLENITIKSENGTTYNLSNSTHVSTLSLFDEVFPSYYTLANSTDMGDALLRYQAYKAAAPPTRNMSYNPFLYNNITTHMNNLAIAMTNVVRSSSNTEMVAGTAFDKESIVDVRWAWLGLPLGMLGLSFVFLVATVIRSSMEQEHVGVWKTSAIATLLYGLPDAMQKKITSSSIDNGTPRAKAKEMRVKWLPRAGWRFSGNVTSPASQKPRHTPPSPEWI